MNLSSLNKILVISPHPDDSEYSCFGIISKLNCETSVLVCSSGGEGDETNKQNRLEEVFAFWKDFPLVDIVHEDFLKLGYHEVVKFLDQYFNSNFFDAIFIPSENDTNQEHRLISQICKSSLRNKSTVLFEYQTPSTTHDWIPNFWLSIEPSLEDKKKRLQKNFKSQTRKSYFKSEYINCFHQDWQAFKRGISFCEKYKLISWMCK